MKMRNFYLFLVSIFTIGISHPAVTLEMAYGSLSEKTGHTLATKRQVLELPGRQPHLLAQQPNPNDDRFLQPELELPTPLPEDPDPVLPERPLPSPESNDGTDRNVLISIDRIEIVGSTVFEDEALRAAVDAAALEGQSVTLQQLDAAADAITLKYQAAGYITSYATVPEQDVMEGVVRIEVIEGRLAEIQVEGNQHLRTDYITSRIGQGLTTPLNPQAIERQLRQFQLNPLINSDSETFGGRLVPGPEPGTSTLVVTLEEARPWQIGVGIDNYSPPSVGSERMSANITHRNLTGWGDSLSATYYRTTTGGSSIWDVGYRLPVNPMEGTLSLRAVINDNELEFGQGDSPFSADGNSELYEISFRQPIIRSLTEEFALSLGFSYRDGSTLFRGADVTFDDVESRTSVFKFGQDYLRRDRQGGWALRSQVSLGTGLFDATDNDSGADGQFFSWLGQVQRVQTLSDNHRLLLQADLQLTPDNLLASEEFLIGGGQSLRGYRQNVRAGDNGFRISVEDQITLLQQSGQRVQIIPFLDMGSVWNEGPNNNDQNFLMGTGLGVLYEPTKNLVLRLDYGIPLIDLDDRQNNLQDDGFYFSLNYRY